MCGDAELGPQQGAVAQAPECSTSHRQTYCMRASTETVPLIAPANVRKAPSAVADLIASTRSVCQLLHCLSHQVMGLLQGKVQNDTFIVIDSFALPVEGTETRVNAQAEAYEYMVDFQGTSKVSLL
eukprot:GHUV01040672.1.p1 GENE.GHUV01040672.1~~GHUV01040672.1.p1  ORF type:complete len:126 (-),score=28.94 GHUV01040672.1:379-756(-)